MVVSRQILGAVARGAVALAFVFGCSGTVSGTVSAAFADDAGKSASAASSGDLSPSQPDEDAGKSGKSGKSDRSGKSSKADEEDKAEAEREAKEEEAAKIRAEADGLSSQADALSGKLSEARADPAAAARELDEATVQRDGASQRLEEENRQLATLQEDLSEFAVEMYKQGGAAPYLDVMLGATSYREFLTSWNMMSAVSERGGALASEKRQISEAIAAEVASYEERISQAERAIAVADSKSKQVEATQLALRLQAAKLNLDAAETVGDRDEVSKAKKAVENAQEVLDDAVARGLAGDGVLSGDGAFTHPCPDATVSSGFGFRIFDNAVHKGIDLAAPSGTPYYAAESGTVTAVTNDGGDNGGAGNWIVIDHGDGLVTKYMHSLVTLVSVGDHVERGQNIGLVGSTGNSTGPHLHFQVESNGTAVDPVAFL